VLRRFTQAVPGKKGRLQGKGSDDAHCRRVIVETGESVSLGQGGDVFPQRRCYVALEVDVQDRFYLALFNQSGPDQCGDDPVGQFRITESTTPVLWTEIARISFEAQRRVRSDSDNHSVQAPSAPSAEDAARTGKTEHNADL
jgi:hypothetical protein